MEGLEITHNSPRLKRYLNRDVLQGDMTEGQTFNRFAYVNGYPIGFIDPLGLMKCQEETVKGFGTRWTRCKTNLKLMDQFTNRRLGGGLGVQVKDVRMVLE